MLVRNVNAQKCVQASITNETKNSIIYLSTNSSHFYAVIILIIYVFIVI